MIPALNEELKNFPLHLASPPEIMDIKHVITKLGRD
jgi:hypothetical protein